MTKSKASAVRLTRRKKHEGNQSHALGYGLITRWTQKEISPHSVVEHNHAHDEDFTPCCKSSLLATFRKGIASSMTGFCGLIQVKSCFCFLQRWEWTEIPAWHHPFFQGQLRPAAGLATTADPGVHHCLTMVVSVNFTYFTASQVWIRTNIWLHSHFLRIFYTDQCSM